MDRILPRRQFRFFPRRAGAAAAAAIAVAAALPWLGPGAGPGAAVAATTVQPESPPAAERSRVTEADLDGSRDAINAALEAGGIDAADAESALALLEQAREVVQRRRSFEQRREELERRAAEIPNTLESIRAQLAEPPATPTPAVPEGATLSDIQQRTAEVEGQLEAARTAVSDLAAEERRRTERAAAIASEAATARTRAAELQASITATTPPATEQPVAHARDRLDLASLQMLEAERQALRAETAADEAATQLLPSRRALAERRVAELESLAAAWRTILNQRREAEARQAEEEARAARIRAARSHPVLQEFAAETEQLAALRTGDERLTLRTELAREKTQERLTRLMAMAGEYEAIRTRLQASGLNRATGALLRRQFDALPDAADLRQRVAAIDETAEEIALQAIEWRDARDRQADTGRTVESLLAAIGDSGPVDPATTPQLRDVARELAAARADVLQALVRDADAFSDALVSLQVATRGLADATEAFESFIRERILWIRSIPAARPITVGDLRSAGAWLLDPAHAGDLAGSLGRVLRQRWIESFGWAAAIVGLLVLSSRARRSIRRLGGEVSSYRTDSFGRSLEALVWTLVLTLPLPLILIAVGRLLGNALDAAGIGRAFGEGFRLTALLLLPYLLLLQVFRPSGLAVAHFRWPGPAVAGVRRHLHWFIIAAAPVTIITVATEVHGDEAMQAAVGRTSFTAAMILMSVFFHRILRPHGPLMAERLGQTPDSWLRRLVWIWFPLLVTAPLVFAIMAWAGWYYTALELQQRLQQTVMLLTVLTIANGFLMRWLFIARRRVAIDEARRKREQLIAEARSRATGEDEPPRETPPPVDEATLNLPAISAQTQQLFRTAIALTLVAVLYLIWVDVAPALRVLDRIQIYPRMAVVEESETAPSPLLVDARAALHLASPGAAAAAPGGGGGGTSPANAAPANAAGGSNGASPPAGNGSPRTTAPGGLPLPPTGGGGGDPAASGGSDATTAMAADTPFTLTLADLGVALLTIILTLIATRNLPALVEIAILQRLPVDAAARYAIGTVLRYVIVMVGLIVAAGAMGITWSKLQWLAAALTFGLAFGLQEIFANFISGLIILAERPVRVGDTVTVGGVSGTVTRIRMRATTITDWDRKELIIPNKTFITADVINWTLSDPTLRTTILVGVSYDEDADQVRSLLMDVASKHPGVLHDPRPQALFTGFGDSTLNFELRVFIASIDDLIAVRHDLHSGILAAFRAAGVEIAFPQRDLHLRSVGDLSRLIDRVAGEPAAEGPAGG
ncbi:MAG: mechanosensitive ion channel domain-containing protein [Planctomycetota bacterium]|jgi:potassium efflux system protein